MRLEVQADRRGRRPRQGLAHVDEVAERLAHLPAFVADEPVVHPRRREWTLAGERVALRAIRLMVAELEVAPSAVNVDLFAEIAHRHRRALEVPAGPSRPELRRPRRLVRRRGAPERKVERVALRVGAHRPAQTLLPQPAQHGWARSVRQPAVTAVMPNA